MRAAIALVAPRYPPAVGGVERCVEMLARGLVKRGHYVEVVTTDPTGRLPPIEDRAGVLVRRFPTVGHDSVYFVAPGLARWLLRNAPRFAIIHAHSYHTPVALAAGLASWRSSLPLVVSPYYHGTGHSPLRRLLHVPYHPIGSWLLRTAGCVICISEAEQAQLHRSFGTSLPTVVIPCAVAVEELKGAAALHKQGGRVRVLAVGRLDAYKQVERLIAALPWLPPEYEFVVIGDGPARNAIARLATQLHVGDRLRLLGHVPRNHLLDWYRTADVLVSLSRHESFGLTLLEAAVAGCSVVASDIPAHREVSGYLPAERVSFVPIDCTPWDLAGSLVEAAHKDRSAYVDRLRLPTWEGAVERTLSVYRKVLGDDAQALRPEVVA